MDFVSLSVGCGDLCTSRPARLQTRQHLLDQQPGLRQDGVIIGAERPQDELRHAGIDIFGHPRKDRRGVSDHEHLRGVAPGVGKAMDAYAKRTGRDADHAFAIGGADTILARIAEYVDAGVSKFVLRPLGGDDDAILAQTRLLIEQVLPRAEARWPRRVEVTAADR